MTVPSNTFLLDGQATMALVSATAFQTFLVMLSPASLAQSGYVTGKGIARSILGVLGLSETPRNIGRTLKGVTFAIIYGQHAWQAFSCLWPRMHRRGITDQIVRLQYTFTTVIAGVPIWSSLDRLSGMSGRS